MSARAAARSPSAVRSHQTAASVGIAVGIDVASLLERPIHHPSWATGNATVGLLGRGHDDVRGHRQILEGSTDGDAHRATVRYRVNDHQQVVVSYTHLTLP